jgi:hypothetical protein
MNSRIAALLLLVGVNALAEPWAGPTGDGQMSGSDPQEFIVGAKPCDVKVRGRSGVWSDFKGEMPRGRVVMGVVNPREPDIIFFQLQKQSPFLFASKRTCFEGETPYVEDPVEAQKSKKLEYPLAFFSLLYIRSPVRVDNDEVVTSTSMIGLPGGGYEWVKGFYRIWTGLGIGYGTSRQTSSQDGPMDDYLSIKVFHFPIYVGGFYDIPDTPYGAGLEATLGWSHTRYQSSATVTTGATSFNWSLGMAWRFYYDNWIFAPKFGVFDRLAATYGEIQVAYLFQ